MTENPVTQLPVTPRAELVLVTPELAESWLGKNTQNRPLKKNKIALYARDMAAGRWQITGETIKFGTDGRLLDGQNRLHAVIQSDTSIQCLVVYGVHPSAQDVMDSGVARSAGDALAMAGMRNAKSVAAAARIAMAIDGKLKIAATNFTNSEVQTWVMDHPEIAEASDALGADARLIPLPASVRIYCLWRLAQIDPDNADEFFTRFATAVGLPQGSPILALRRRLQGDYGTERRITQEEQVISVFRAWNAWREGRPLQRVLGAEMRGSGIPTPI